MSDIPGGAYPGRPPAACCGTLSRAGPAHRWNRIGRDLHLSGFLGNSGETFAGPCGANGGCVNSGCVDYELHSIPALGGKHETDTPAHFADRGWVRAIEFDSADAALRPAHQSREESGISGRGRASGTRRCGVQSRCEAGSVRRSRLLSAGVGEVERRYSSVRRRTRLSREANPEATRDRSSSAAGPFSRCESGRHSQRRRCTDRRERESQHRGSNPFAGSVGNRFRDAIMESEAVLSDPRPTRCRRSLPLQ